MADTYMVGEFRRLYYVAETIYGTTLTSALVYAGLPVAVRPKFNAKVTPEYVPASRGFGYSNREAIEAGFTYVGKAQVVSGGYDWRNFFAVYAYGATSGIQDGTTTYGRLGSFSAIVGVTQGTANRYQLYNGCKIDSLKISPEGGVGSDLLFEAEIISEMIDYSTTKTFSNFQSVTVAADPTIITTATLKWNGTMQINIAAGGLVTVSPTTWSLTVRNNLAREPGLVTGNDAAVYPLAAIALSENKRDILFEMTLPRKSETYQNAKVAGSAVTALTIVVGANTITLSGGVFVADDLPELKQDLNDETVKVIFNALAIG